MSPRPVLPRGNMHNPKMSDFLTKRKIGFNLQSRPVKCNADYPKDVLLT